MRIHSPDLHKTNADLKLMELFSKGWGESLAWGPVGGQVNFNQKWSKFGTIVHLGSKTSKNVKNAILTLLLRLYYF